VTETAQGASGATATAVRTFLIADVRGYTHFTLEHGDDAAARLAARFAELTRETISARGGEVTELRGDEALAVFMSTRQALWAATELQARFAQEMLTHPSLPLKVGIGLDSGEAIPVAGGYRGAALNLAARLSSLAGAGEVLASDGVIHLARKIEGLAYHDRGKAQLKGFAQPVGIYGIMPEEPQGVDDHRDDLLADVAGREGADQVLPIGGFLGSLPDGPLVARARELDTSLAALDAAQSGRGRTVLLTGEPGAGKTRLAQEVTLAARDRDFLIAAGRCYEAEQSVPYYPFLDAVAGAYRAAPAQLRRDAAERWPYLGALLPDQIGVPEAAAGGPDEQQRVFNAATGFLEAVSEFSPVAVLLDDLHWADGASLKLLLHLSRHTRSARILILGTYRDVEVARQHPLEDAVRDLSREGLTERISVRRLDRDGTCALIAATIGEGEISEEFAGLVHGRTEGNPFFVQQVMRMLVERGDVFRREGQWDRKDLDSIEVPESIRSVIGQRLTRLPKETQEILHEASILGQSFLFDDLLAMGARQEGDVEEAFEATIRVGLIREMDGEGYAFDHALTQQVLYGELTARRRRKLHLAAGEAIEKLPERKRQKRTAELAWHFLKGDDAERALPYALQAGDSAEAVFAHSDAELHYRTSLELALDLSDRPRQAEALEKLGAVLLTASRFDEALESLERAASLYEIESDEEGETSVLARIGEVHLRRGTIDEGLARLEPLRSRLDHAKPSSPLAAFHVTLSRLSMKKGRFHEQLAEGEKAMEIARAIGDQRQLRSAQAARAAGLFNVGRMDESIPMYEELVRLAEEVGDYWNLHRALHSLAEHARSQGDRERTMRLTRQAIEAAQRMDDPALIAEQTILTGWFCLQLGDWNEARTFFERGLACARSSDIPAQRIRAAGSVALFELRTGDEGAAWALAREVEETAARLGNTSLLRWAAGQLARIELESGRPVDAVARLSRCAPGHSKIGIGASGRSLPRPTSRWDGTPRRINCRKLPSTDRRAKASMKGG
jgi:class 3 adenylate cyclase/tetratricopeptide (TPR) repeat protein